MNPGSPRNERLHGMYKGLTRLIQVVFVLLISSAAVMANPVTSPSSGYVVAGNSLSVTATFSSITTAEVSISVDGLGTMKGAGSGRVYSAVFVVPNGVHVETVGVTATSGDGQSLSSTSGVKIKSTLPPAPTITSPSDGTVIYEPGNVTVPVEGSVTGGSAGAARVLVKVDGSQVASLAIGSTANTFSTNVTLPAGKNAISIQATAVDAAGNVSEPSNMVTINRDTTPPPAPTIATTQPAGPVDSSVLALEKVIVTFNTSVEANVRRIYLIINGVAQSPENVTMDGNNPVSPHEFTNIDFPLSVKKLELRAVVIDALGQHSEPSAPVVVERETDPPEVLEIEIVEPVEPNVDGKIWVKRDVVTMRVRFNEPMDQSEAHEPIMFLQCRGEEDFGALLPIAVDGVWEDESTWKVTVDIAGPSFSIDGHALVRIQQCHDLSGNGLSEPIITGTVPPLHIDTTPPQPVLSAINPNPEAELYGPARDFTVPCNDRRLTGIPGIGVATEELELWVDFNGDGIFAESDASTTPPFRERFTYANDSQAGILTWTGSEIRFDPTKTDWKTYRASPVKVRLVMLQDKLGNKIDSHYEWSFEIDKSGLAGPEVSFVNWGEQAITTPPEGAYTSDNQQNVRISIRPDPVTLSKIDTDVVIVKINGVNYGIHGTDSIYANPGLTMDKAGAPTHEIILDFNPASVTPDPLVYDEGAVVVEIRNVKDRIGKKAAVQTRRFFVDTVPPAIASTGNAMSPPNGGVVFKGTLPPLRPHLKVYDAGGAPLNLSSAEVILTSGDQDFAPQLQVSSVYDDSTGITTLSLEPKSDDDSVNLGNGDYSITFKGIADQAGNELPETTWQFFIRTDMGLHSMLFMPNPTALNRTSVEVEIAYAMEMPPTARPVTIVLHNADTYAFDTHSTGFGSQQTKADGRYYVKYGSSYYGLKPGENNIVGYLVDSLGFESNAAYNKFAVVVSDRYPPSVPGPFLDPLKDIYSGKVTVRWPEVGGAHLYEIQVSTDAGGNSPVQTWNTTLTYVDIHMPDKPHDTYYVRVRAADGVGNWSALSKPLCFVVDHTRPVVESITVEDPTPNSSNTPVYPNTFEAGEILVRVKFSEAMDTSMDMGKERRVRIMFHSREIQEITKGEWVSDRVWVGSTDPTFIPAEMRVSGKLTVMVQGARDKAGNEMDMTRSSTFFIQHRPKILTPMIFPNPLDTRDLIINVETVDRLKSNPAIWVNDEPVEVVSYSDKHFAGVFRMKEMRVGRQNIRVSGESEQGNVGHWPESQDDLLSSDSRAAMSSPARFGKFVTHRAGPDKSSVWSYDNILRVELDDSLSSEDTMVAVIPWDISRSVKGGPVRVPAAEPVSELLPVGPAYMVNITGNGEGNIAYSFSVCAEILEDFDVHYDQVGLYRFDGQYWRPLESSGDESNARCAPATDEDINDGSQEHQQNHTVSAFSKLQGIIAPMADISPPVFQNVTPADNEIAFSARPDIRFVFDEKGSGLCGAEMTINDMPVSPDEIVVNRETNTVSWSPVHTLAEGEYRVLATVWDRAGNRAPVAESIFRSPGALRAEQIRVYPVPASDTMTIDASFNQVVDVVKLEITDSSGRRVWSDEEYNAGDVVFFWDLINSRGRSVANGVYYLRIRAEGDSSIEITRKAAVLR